MPEFTLDGRPINYQVRFSSRRSISIKILSAQCLEITAPLHTSSQAIENALLAKSRWLQKHIARFASMAAININQEILHGAQVLYLGQRRQLFLCASCLTAPGVTLEGDTLVIVTDTVPAETQAAKLLKDWYIQQATDILPAKTALWATKIGIQPQRVTIREQKSRWGSCSNRGNINYNWRIIMAPQRLLIILSFMNYVI